MSEDRLNSMHIPVCQIPLGRGFSVEHMPEFLEQEDFDNSAPHVHSFYEILWFREGQGIHTVDFIEYEVTPNTIFFLSPGQIHHFDPRKDYCGVSIKACTGFLRDEEGTHNKFLKYSIFHNSDSTPCYHIDDEVAAELDRWVQEMERELYHTQDFGNTDILQSLLYIFLIKIQRHGEREGNLRLDTLKPSHLLFINFRSLVEKEYTRLHSVQEYADRLNVAVRTLNKCVNDCADTSPLAFINNRIMLEAKRLVRYSNLMIKEIAFSLGYDDPSYFVKFFKRQTGFLPSDFRETDCVLHCQTRP